LDLCEPNAEKEIIYPIEFIDLNLNTFLLRKSRKQILFLIEFKNTKQKTLYWSYKYLVDDNDELICNDVYKEPLFTSQVQTSFLINTTLLLKKRESYVYFGLESRKIEIPVINYLFYEAKQVFNYKFKEAVKLRIIFYENRGILADEERELL
jgi:hypothetical protein